MLLDTAFKVQGFRNYMVCDRVADYMNQLNPMSPVKVEPVSWDPNPDDETRLPEDGAIWLKVRCSYERLAHFREWVERELKLAIAQRPSLRQALDAFQIGVEPVGPSVEEIPLAVLLPEHNDPVDQALTSYLSWDDA